jgi:hypothetical protein
MGRSHSHRKKATRDRIEAPPYRYRSRGYRAPSVDARVSDLDGERGRRDRGDDSAEVGPPGQGTKGS